MAPLGQDYKRQDGRVPETMRTMTVELGGLSTSDGSATFGFGAEEVIAGFHGPFEADRRDELIDRAALRIHHRPLESIPGVASKAISSTFTDMYTPLLNLDAHPKAMVQLTLQSNTSRSASLNYTSKSHRAACINAATLAILDGGSMDLKGVPVACAIAMVPTVPRETRYDPDASYMAVDATMAAENDDDDDDDDDERVTMLLDPTFDEERQAKASFVIAWAFGQGLATNRDESGKDPEAECVLMESEGAFDQIQLQKAYNASRIACQQILHRIRVGRTGST